MKNKRIQKLRAQWFAFKTNQFNMAGIRTGAKHGVVAAIFYLFILSPSIWITLGHLNAPEDQFVSIGLIIFSTTIIFGAIFIPLFMILGLVFGFVITKSMEKTFFETTKAKFTFRNTAIATGIALILILIAASFVFDIHRSESLFNLILMCIAPLITLIGHVFFSSLILFQRALDGDL